MSAQKSRSQPASNQADHVVDTVEEVFHLDDEDHITKSWADRLADKVATHVGSMTVVAVHAVGFSAWIVLNLPVRFAPQFDPFPFSALTLGVALEAIFLSMFVLMSQNRQGRREDRRAKVELHVNMIAEREITKVLSMLGQVQSFLGMQSEPDTEARAMERPVRVEELVHAVDARRGRHPTK